MVVENLFIKEAKMAKQNKKSMAPVVVEKSAKTRNVKSHVKERFVEIKNEISDSLVSELKKQCDNLDINGILQIAKVRLVSNLTTTPEHVINAITENKKIMETIYCLDPNGVESGRISFDSNFKDYRPSENDNNGTFAWLYVDDVQDLFYKNFNYESKDPCFEYLTSRAFNVFTLEDENPFASDKPYKSSKPSFITYDDSSFTIATKTNDTYSSETFSLNEIKTLGFKTSVMYNNELFNLGVFNLIKGLISRNTEYLKSILDFSVRRTIAKRLSLLADEWGIQKFLRDRGASESEVEQLKKYFSDLSKDYYSDFKDRNEDLNRSSDFLLSVLMSMTTRYSSIRGQVKHLSPSALKHEVIIKDVRSRTFKFEFNGLGNHFLYYIFSMLKFGDDRALPHCRTLKSLWSSSHDDIVNEAVFDSASLVVTAINAFAKILIKDMVRVIEEKLEASASDIVKEIKSRS